MGHYCALVIRHDSDADSVSKTIRELTTLSLVQNVEPGSVGSRCVHVGLPVTVLDDVVGTERRIQRVARKFGLRVALVLAVSASDSFLYVHWYSGQITRALGCSLEEQGMWSRVSGDPEEWEAEAFQGEEVSTADGHSRLLGRSDAGTIESPRRGEFSFPPHAMKYAELAIASSINAGER